MDDETYKQECAEKRERAERVFREELSSLEEKLSLPAALVEMVRGATTVKLLLEEIPALKAEIAALKAENVTPEAKAAFPSTGEDASDELEDLFSKMDVVLHQMDVSHKENLLSLYEGLDFAYDSIPHAILVGSTMDERDDEDYADSMRAEIGHALYDFLPRFRTDYLFGGVERHEDFDSAVDEFYDIICWKYADPVLKSSYVQALKRAQSYCELSKVTADPREMARLAVQANPREMARLAVQVLPHKDNYKILTPSNPAEIEGRLYKIYSVASTLSEDHLFGIGKVVAPLLDEISGQKGIPVEECLPLLAWAGARAMSDPDIDFSSPECFVETVKQQLPEYLELQNG